MTKLSLHLMNLLLLIKQKHIQKTHSLTIVKESTQTQIPTPPPATKSTQLLRLKTKLTTYKLAIVKLIWSSSSKVKWKCTNMARWIWWADKIQWANSISTLMAILQCKRQPVGLRTTLRSPSSTLTWPPSSRWSRAHALRPIRQTTLTAAQLQSCCSSNSRICTPCTTTVDRVNTEMHPTSSTSITTWPTVKVLTM